MEVQKAGSVTFPEPPKDKLLVRLAKICMLPKDLRFKDIIANIGDISNTLHSQVPSHHMQQKRLLELKAPNWKEWAFTADGSCIINKENGSQSIGAGVYHPQSNKITTVNPGGTSINKTINRAKLPSRNFCCIDK